MAVRRKNELAGKQIKPMLKSDTTKRNQNICLDVTLDDIIEVNEIT